MVNAWSLLYDEINGTLDEEYPIMTAKNENYDDFENPVGHLNPPEAFGPGNPLRDPLSWRKITVLLRDSKVYTY